MRKSYIDLNGAWGILLCFDYDRHDIGEMRSIMESFGMTEYDIIEAIDVLGHYNTGMAISDEKITMSVMFVSPATDLGQFMDSIAHEIDHVQDAIIRFYDVMPGTEDAAWTQGYMMRIITRILKSEGFLCECGQG